MTFIGNPIPIDQYPKASRTRSKAKKLIHEAYVLMDSRGRFYKQFASHDKVQWAEREGAATFYSNMHKIAEKPLVRARKAKDKLDTAGFKVDIYVVKFEKVEV